MTVLDDIGRQTLAPEATTIVTVDAGTAAAASAKRSAWARLPRSGKVALVVIVLVALMALSAPWLAPKDPNVGVTADRLKGIGSPGFPLGTDGQGRDILSRVIWASRPSLLTGLIPVAVAGVIGMVLGLVAGLGGRRTNGGIMRVLDVFYAFPAILLAIAIATVLGSGSSNAIIALCVVLIPPIARLAESETSRLRGLDFMEAAEASGASRMSIARRHVLPNVAPPVVIYATALIGLSIVYAAGLSFLGLGVGPPTAEWGLMVSDLRQYIFTDAALALVPAVAIVIVSVAFNVLGDGLRDVFDVRTEAPR
jgi:peptide/nickel transport system permease protein